MDVFTVVVFLYNVGVAYFQQCTVRTLRVDADKTGARVNGYTYITFSNIGPNACYNECIRRTKCRSFNYNSITRRCDINKMTSSSETEFVDETNCVYVDMTQYRGQCTVRTLRVDADKTGVRLNGYTYITFSNIGPNACFNECIRRTKCHSFNYNSITRRCDINKITNSSETDFVDETNCVYVDMTQYRGDSYYDPCPGSDACVEGEFCQTLKDDKKICNRDVKECEVDGYVRYTKENLCLKLVSTSGSTWTSARAVCLNEGAELVSITTLEKMKLMQNLLKGINIWIGLQSKRWMTGDIFQNIYTMSVQLNDYDSGYHTDSDASCGSLTAGALQDESCNIRQKTSFVCEIVL